MAYSKRSGKNNWALFWLILAGIVIGGLIGDLTKGISFLEWLNYGKSFGIPEAISIDLRVIQLSFQLIIHISIASIIGVAISIFVYRKI